jgi:acetyl esterase/lipase
MNFRTPTIVLSFGLAAFATSSLALAQQTTLPLWPHATPEPPQTTAPETDATKPTDGLISGRRTARLTNVTVPTLSVYPPHDHNTGAAALVFPGGGYSILAWDGEGLDVCHWLNAIGMTCLLVKYRVPEDGRYPENPADLEDAQQAMRLSRAHATDWHIDPNRIGIIGFSAGAHLAVLLSTHPDDQHVLSTPAAPDVPTLAGAVPDARANFALILYPGYLSIEPARTELNPILTPNQLTPATFLLQAENDPVHVENSLVYFSALKAAKIPAELHIFASGGHGFGVFPINKPESNWTELATTWLRSINILAPLPPPHLPTPSTSSAPPCPIPQPPPAGNPTNPAASNTNNPSAPNNNPSTIPNPNCW